MTAEEVAEYKAEPQPQLKKIRDSHHRMARLFAMGWRLRDVAAECGYTAQAVMIASKSPAFQELIAHYRDVVDEEYKEELGGYFGNINKARDLSARMILDQLAEADETGEAIPLNRLASIHGDLADRTGFGKRVDIRHSVDFADALDKAIGRSAKVINHSPNEPAVSTVPQSPQQVRGELSLAPPTNGAGLELTAPVIEQPGEVSQDPPPTRLRRL